MVLYNFIRVDCKFQKFFDMTSIKLPELFCFESHRPKIFKRTAKLPLKATNFQGKLLMSCLTLIWVGYLGSRFQVWGGVKLHPPNLTWNYARTLSVTRRKKWAKCDKKKKMSNKKNPKWLPFFDDVIKKLKFWFLF